VYLSQAINTLLFDNAAVIGLAGTTADGAPCIFWVERDQGSPLPALILFSVGGPPEDLDLDDGADFVETRIQFRAMASTHAKANALLKAATDVLMGDAEVDNFLFWGADRDRPIDLGSGTASGGVIHEVTQDVILRHSQST
jgi:hypothetical protein